MDESRQSTGHRRCGRDVTVTLITLAAAWSACARDLERTPVLGLPAKVILCDHHGDGKVCDDRSSGSARGMGSTWRQLPYGRATAIRWGLRTTGPERTSPCSLR